MEIQFVRNWQGHKIGSVVNSLTDGVADVLVRCGVAVEKDGIAVDFEFVDPGKPVKKLAAKKSTRKTVKRRAKK